MTKNIIRILSIIGLVILVFIGYQNTNSQQFEQDLYHVKSNHKEDHKKIIFIMVDALMYQAIDEGIRNKELPAFQFLIEQGQYFKDMVTTFPTMSVTIESSFLTGSYPDNHHVPGLIWYDSNEKRVINYGTGTMEVFKHGMNPTLVDALIRLNGSHLKSGLSTIYDELAQHGLKSGSINGLLYRGQTEHTLTIPPWIQLPTSLKSKEKVKGPDFMALGSLSNPLQDVKELPDGITRHMGFNDDYSMETLKYLVEENKLPDFLFVYLPDLDREIHENGPPGDIKEVDRQLQALLQSFDSPEQALDDVIFMIAGDSGMTPVAADSEESIIELATFFEDYHVWRTGEEVDETTDIILAVNETMAYVYNLTDQPLEDIVDRLTTDPRIDFISWKNKEWMYAVQGETSKILQFKADGELVDPYKQRWTVQQEFEVLDLKTNPTQDELEYGQYPDVLKRLSGALDSHIGDFLIVTARPGYEFADRSSPQHVGGGVHGSLGEMESLVPLIITGTDQKPEHLRMVDLKAFLLDLLVQE